MTTTDELAKKAINHARENPNLLKTHIFFEATKELDRYSARYPIHKRCFQSYEKMSEKFGDDAMDYQEFEFWFMRISSGDFDIDYDRRLAPKNRSFTDLPVHIFEMITKGFCLSDRLVIREVSKALRSVIDASLPIPSKIKIEVSESSWTANFDNESVKFSDNKMVARGEWVNMPTRTHWTHLLSIFRNPNLRLKFLSLHYPKVQSPEKFNKMLQVAQNKKIHVESLEIISDSKPKDLDTLIPLQYLDTGILQKLYFSHRVDRITDIKQILEKLVGFERFQQKPMIDCRGKIIGDYQQSLRFILNPPKVTLYPCGMAARDLAEVIKHLMQSTVLEKFNFHASNEFPAATLLTHFKRPDFFKPKDISADIRFHKIQENQFWRIRITQTTISVRKVDHFY